MAYKVQFDPDFESELQTLGAKVNDALFVKVDLLEQFGPALGRPHVDKLHGSSHANMKELRFDAGGGKWRVAFAFDPARKAILLVAGDKAGVNQRRFYKSIVAKADERYDRHLGKQGGRG